MSEAISSTWKNAYEIQNKILKDTKAELDQALAAIKLLREALEFYADRENWDDDAFSPTIWDDGNIDLGRKAKAALSATKQYEPTNPQPQGEKG